MRVTLSNLKAQTRRAEAAKRKLFIVEEQCRLLERERNDLSRKLLAITGPVVVSNLPSRDNPLGQTFTVQVSPRRGATYEDLETNKRMCEYAGRHLLEQMCRAGLARP